MLQNIGLLYPSDKRILLLVSPLCYQAVGATVSDLLGFEPFESPALQIATGTDIGIHLGEIATDAIGLHNAADDVQRCMHILFRIRGGIGAIGIAAPHDRHVGWAVVDAI